jgi:hypothetical protein
MSKRKGRVQLERFKKLKYGSMIKPFIMPPARKVRGYQKLKYGWEPKPPARKAEKPDGNSFYQGMAVVLAALVRDHDQPTMARDIMKCNGVTVGHLKKANVDDFDMRHLRRLARYGRGKA